MPTETPFEREIRVQEHRCHVNGLRPMTGVERRAFKERCFPEEAANTSPLDGLVNRKIAEHELKCHANGLRQMRADERDAFKERFIEGLGEYFNELLDRAIDQRNSQRGYAGGLVMDEAETKLFRENLATPDARAILLSQDADKVMKLISTAPERSGWKFPEALAMDRAASSPSR